MAFNRLNANLLMLTSPLFLGGCQYAALVELTQTHDNNIQIDVTRKGNASPCVYGLSINHTLGGKQDVVWNIYLDTGYRNFCVSRFIYPNVPPHYHLLQPTIALAAGQKYTVSITGVGFGIEEGFVRAAIK